MARFGKKLATGVATFALAAVNGGGIASAEQAVDKDTGPVSYANPASLQITNGDDPEARPARLVTETQRSPLRPGTSRLDQADRRVVPGDGDESGIAPYYRINLGQFSQDDSPYPAGIASREHEVSASLRESRVPAATARTNYALRYLPAGPTRRGDGSADTVLALQHARSTVACSGADELTSRSAATLWVIDSSGSLERVPLRDGRSVTRENLPFGPPVDGMQDTDVRSDVTISKIGSFDELIRQDAWRNGAATAAAGWRIEIVTHPESAPEQTATAGSDTSATPDGPADDRERTIRTTIVLGGVSCSIPRGFRPAEVDARGAVALSQRPSVPLAIPSGGRPPTGAPGDGLGYLLIGGGVLAGAGVAFLVIRRSRRGPAASRDTAQDGPAAGSD